MKISTEVLDGPVYQTHFLLQRLQRKHTFNHFKTLLKTCLQQPL